MKKGLKYLSLGLTCIRILGGDGIGYRGSSQKSNQHLC